MKCPKCKKKLNSISIFSILVSKNIYCLNCQSKLKFKNDNLRLFLGLPACFIIGILFSFIPSEQMYIWLLPFMVISLIGLFAYILMLRAFLPGQFELMDNGITIQTDEVFFKISLFPIKKYNPFSFSVRMFYKRDIYYMLIFFLFLISVKFYFEIFRAETSRSILEVMIEPKNFSYWILCINCSVFLFLIKTLLIYATWNTHIVFYSNVLDVVYCGFVFNKKYFFERIPYDDICKIGRSWPSEFVIKFFTKKQWYAKSKRKIIVWDFYDRVEKFEKIIDFLEFKSRLLRTTL